MRSRAASIFIAISASLNPMASCCHRGLPNCLRSCAYSSANLVSRARMPPSAPAPTPGLSRLQRHQCGQRTGAAVVVRPAHRRGDGREESRSLRGSPARCGFPDAQLFPCVHAEAGDVLGTRKEAMPEGPLKGRCWHRSHGSARSRRCRCRTAWSHSEHVRVLDPGRARLHGQRVGAGVRLGEAEAAEDQAVGVGESGSQRCSAPRCRSP